MSNVIYSCGDISHNFREGYNAYNEAVAARRNKCLSTALAKLEHAGVKHTQEGDFTHLAPVGSLHFRRAR